MHRSRKVALDHQTDGVSDAHFRDVAVAAARSAYSLGSSKLYWLKPQIRSLLGHQMPCKLETCSSARSQMNLTLSRPLDFGTRHRSPQWDSTALGSRHPFPMES